MNDGINGVHHDAEYNSQADETPRAMRLRSRVTASGDGGDLKDDENHVELRGDRQAALGRGGRF